MKKIAIFLTVFMTLGIVGCEKNFLDINDDPNVPTVAEPSKLLTGAQASLGETFSQNDFIGNGLSSYVHQLVSREVQQYNITSSGSISNTWQWAFTYVNPNLDELIKTSEENGNLQYAGIAKILKAYTFSVMVDIFGDVPYSEANIPGLIAPKLDAGDDIYNALLSLLDEAKLDLTNTEATNMFKPGSDDLIYNGDVAKWERLANTLKLRLLLNSRLTPEKITNYTTQLNDLVTEDNFIAEGEDFEFWFNSQTAPDQRHPAFIDEYDGGQITYYVSPWFYEIMRGLSINATNNPFAGIDDPRVPYYWANQLTDGVPAQNPHEYRHDNFVSIFFGSIGPNTDFAQRESATMVGIYPCGGKFDDGNGSNGEGFTGADGDGIAPHKFLTYASYKFMLAELAITGEITADPATLYEEAVRAAYSHVNKVVSKSSKDVPTIANGVIDAHVAQLMTAFNAASNEVKYEMIMTQKWISNFFNPVETYADYRRTGYPVLFDATQGIGIVPIDYNGNTNVETPVQLIRLYPKSIWYPDREVELNPNITQKANLSEARIFWDTRNYDY